MHDIVVLAKGVLAGLAISAPVGPATMLCLSYTLARGRAAGILTGLGAGTVDTLYGAVAGFSIRFLIGFLIREEEWIRLFGGLLLAGIGARYYFKKPRTLRQERQRDASRSGYLSGFLLNLANPTVVLSFLAILAALGVTRHKSWGQDVTLVSGIFLGAMLWWIGLATIAGRFQGELQKRTIVRMNRIAGLTIGGFGVATLILAEIRA
jgi:threonine/homoserine/homoserine lactone efflux protein